MAVVRNLMIRIGADYSPARHALQGATREVKRFRDDTKRATAEIRGKKGMGGISTEVRELGQTVTSTFAQIRGVKGIGGVASALGNLRPVMGTATKGLAGLGAAAGGAGAALGSVALGVGAVTAALGLMVVGLYQASQEAVRFDASIKRLNMQLGANSRAFMDWASSMGLAKTSAAEMGATYSTLLASFIHDSNELAKQTMQLVHTTRVVASATGRSIEDVTERMRSGLLGNTEAIEDLGIFVNVAMIESTEAFRRFAGDKSWNQLTYQQQQQIRLAAILEQAYKRYGNQLQASVMTKQERLMEQLKDIKLHLSQAFMPIWDAILPALTRLAEALANATEHLARFMYLLRGWDYDEMTRGSDKATDAIDRQTESYDELTDSVKSARKELAAFDEINQLGDFGGGTSGRGGGTHGSTPPDLPYPDPDGGKGWDWPKIPPELLKRYRIEFDPPNPPDAGLGAVATAVTSTVNGMIAQTKTAMAQMWGDLQAQTQLGAQGQFAEWNALSNGLQFGTVPVLTQGVGAQWRSMWDHMQAQSESGHAGQLSIWQRMQQGIGAVTIPALVAAVLTNWANMWNSMRAQTEANSQAIQGTVSQMNLNMQTDSLTTTTAISTNWSTMLSGMLAELQNHNPLIGAEWSIFGETIKSLQIPMALTEGNWKTMLANMLADFNVFMPGFTPEWLALGATILSLNPQLDTTKISWSNAFSDMYNIASTKLNGIITKINETISAFLAMQAMMGAPAVDMGKVGSTVKNALSSVWDTITGIHNQIQAFFDAGANTLTFGLHNKMLEDIDTERVKAQKGVAGQAGSVVGGLVGGAGAARGASAALTRWGDDVLNWLRNAWQGLSKAVPQFATGGIVYGPTLAMIGEAGKEAVIPLENTSFVDTLASAIGTAVVQAQQVAQSGQESDREIVIQIDGTTLARVLYSYQQQEQQRRGPAVIRTV